MSSALQVILALLVAEHSRFEVACHIFVSAPEAAPVWSAPPPLDPWVVLAREVDPYDSALHVSVACLEVHHQ